MFYQKHVDAHNTCEYRTNLSEKVRNAYQRDDVIERHIKSVNSQTYREKMASTVKKRWEDDSYRSKVSESLKSSLASPEKRKEMSDAAKASTEKRLETRRKNQLTA